MSAQESTSPRAPAPTIWQRATYRWTAITAVMGVLLVIYTQHPYYKGGQFQPWRSYYPIAFVGWLAFGLFYVRATLEKFQGARFTLRDGGLHLLILGRALLRKTRDPAERARLAQHARTSVRWGVGIAVGLTVLAALARGVGVSTFFPEQYFGALTNLRPAPVQLGAGFVIEMAIGALAGLFYHWLAEHAPHGRFWRTANKPRLRTTCLGIVVKGFFTPLMIGFFSGHARTIFDLWLRHKHLAPFTFKAPTGNAFVQLSAWAGYMAERIPAALPNGADVSGFFAAGSWTRADFSWGLDVAYNIVFFVDCGMALIGYSLESRWLGNKTRSVEPTFLGWAAALSCYPPFNNVLGTYLPLENGPDLVSDNTHIALRAVTVILFTIYASATVAFGFKFSNLTNRGIISRGPYRYIRHPAYVTKCTAWWLEHAPTMTLTKAVFLSLLCCVYALRAWTEERHLSRDPDYRAYKRKVPWVILPGVF
ncbi:MAG: GTP-binding protein EngA [Labilithrix sp.]|nr:GTP-binding protein EngA [Labilithrix sp.]